MIPDVQPISPSQSWHALRDAVLTDALRDRLCHDRRTAHLDLAVRVDGGVAHVSGTVATDAERQLVRTLLRQHNGLYAVWDLLALPGQPLALADIGCGGHKQVPEAIGVDRVAHAGVDVVTDLEGPLPCADETFDHLFAIHVVEHIHDLLGLLRELHRILRPTGVLHILTPNWRHVNAVADPTHIRYMDMQTFKYFCQTRPGVLPWRPLMLSATDDTIFADLQPIKHGGDAPGNEIARWFYT